MKIPKKKVPAKQVTCNTCQKRFRKPKGYRKRSCPTCSSLTVLKSSFGKWLYKTVERHSDIACLPRMDIQQLNELYDVWSTCKRARAVYRDEDGGRIKPKFDYQLCHIAPCKVDGETTSVISAKNFTIAPRVLNQALGDTLPDNDRELGLTFGVVAKRLGKVKDIKAYLIKQLPLQEFQQQHQLKPLSSSVKSFHSLVEIMPHDVIRIEYKRFQIARKPPNELNLDDGLNVCYWWLPLLGMMKQSFAASRAKHDIRDYTPKIVTAVTTSIDKASFKQYVEEESSEFDENGWWY